MSSNKSTKNDSKKDYDHLLHLSDDLEKLFINQDLTDVVIVANDQEHHVHKSILVARSPVFLAMLKNDMKEKENNVIVITDINSEIIKEMIYFMYTGKVKNIDNIVVDLLSAADKYDIDSLKKKCSEYLRSNLSIKNVTEILRLIDLYSLVELKPIAYELIADCVDDFLQLDDFKELDKTHPQVVIDALRNVLPMINKKLKDVFVKVDKLEETIKMYACLRRPT